MDEKILRFDEVRNALLSKFPEVQDWATRNFGANYNLDEDAPEQYPLFEGVVKKMLFDLLLEEPANVPLLRHLFDFFETMASSSDRDVGDLLGISILEPLVYNRKSARRALEYMGPKMQELTTSEARRQHDLLSDLPDC